MELIPVTLSMKQRHSLEKLAGDLDGAYGVSVGDLVGFDERAAGLPASSSAVLANTGSSHDSANSTKSCGGSHLARF